MAFARRGLVERSPAFPFFIVFSTQWKESRRNILKATSTDRQTRRLQIFKICIYLASDNTLIILVYSDQMTSEARIYTCACGLPVLSLHKFNFLGFMLRLLSFPFSSLSVFRLILINLVSVTFFPESPLNTETRIIRTIWHFPLVSVLTASCNVFQFSAIAQNGQKRTERRTSSIKNLS